MNRIVNQDGYSATFMTRQSVFSEQFIVLEGGVDFWVPVGFTHDDQIWIG